MQNTSDMKNRRKKPLFLADMTQEELVHELEKGIADIREGRVYTAKEVNRKLESMMKLKI